MMTRDANVYFVDGCGRCKLGGTPQCKVHTWASELALLRQLMLECGLEEDCKWGMPCYTVNGKNVLIISAFKDYCCLNFFKGSLIRDEANILSKAGENSEVARMFKCTTVKEIQKNYDTLKAYVYESVEIEKSGVKTMSKPVTEYEIPTELTDVFAQKPDVQQAFENLTPGRKKAYLIHFNGAKQSQTRINRIEKCIPGIMAGKGWNEQ